MLPGIKKAGAAQPAAALPLALPVMMARVRAVRNCLEALITFREVNFTVKPWAPRGQNTAALTDADQAIVAEINPLVQVAVYFKQENPTQISMELPGPQHEQIVVYTIPGLKHRHHVELSKKGVPELRDETVDPTLREFGDSANDYLDRLNRLVTINSQKAYTEAVHILLDCAKLFSAASHYIWRFYYSEKGHIVHLTADSHAAFSKKLVKFIGNLPIDIQQRMVKDFQYPFTVNEDWESEGFAIGHVPFVFEDNFKKPIVKSYTKAWRRRADLFIRLWSKSFTEDHRREIDNVRNVILDIENQVTSDVVVPRPPGTPAPEDGSIGDFANSRAYKVISELAAKLGLIPETAVPVTAADALVQYGVLRDTIGNIIKLDLRRAMSPICMQEIVLKIAGFLPTVKDQLAFLQSTSSLRTDATPDGLLLRRPVSLQEETIMIARRRLGRDMYGRSRLARVLNRHMKTQIVFLGGTVPMEWVTMLLSRLRLVRHRDGQRPTTEFNFEIGPMFTDMDVPDNLLTSGEVVIFNAAMQLDTLANVPTGANRPILENFEWRPTWCVPADFIADFMKFNRRELGYAANLEDFEEYCVHQVSLLNIRMNHLEQMNLVKTHTARGSIVCMQTICPKMLKTAADIIDFISSMEMKSLQTPLFQTLFHPQKNVALDRFTQRFTDLLKFVIQAGERFIPDYFGHAHNGKDLYISGVKTNTFRKYNAAGNRLRFENSEETELSEFTPQRDYRFDLAGITEGVLKLEWHKYGSVATHNIGIVCFVSELLDHFCPELLLLMNQLCDDINIKRDKTPENFENRLVEFLGSVDWSSEVVDGIELLIQRFQTRLEEKLRNLSSEVAAQAADLLLLKAQEAPSAHHSYRGSTGGYESEEALLGRRNRLRALRIGIHPWIFRAYELHPGQTSAFDENEELDHLSAPVLANDAMDVDQEGVNDAVVGDPEE